MANVPAPSAPAERLRVLITGASSGIGAAFAHAFAARGDDLVLVARSAAKLEALATDLAVKHNVRADVIVADLAQPEATDAIVAELAARSIGIGTLINNAGFSSHGLFAELDPARERDEVMVNVFAVVALARAVLPAMVARRAGAILNVASTAAFQPIPFQATYAATKAFVLSFSQALSEEVRAQGVRVVALCPGVTDTPFFDTIADARFGRARSVEQVVSTGLRALDRGTSVAIDGFANGVMANGARFAPRTMVVKLAGYLQRPKSRPR
jgi:short-subunit dehydrogenase